MQFQICGRRDRRFFNSTNNSSTTFTSRVWSWPPDPQPPRNTFRQQSGTSQNSLTPSRPLPDLPAFTAAASTCQDATATTEAPVRADRAAIILPGSWRTLAEQPTICSRQPKTFISPSRPRFLWHFGFTENAHTQRSSNDQRQISVWLWLGLFYWWERWTRTHDVWRCKQRRDVTRSRDLTIWTCQTGNGNVWFERSLIETWIPPLSLSDETSPAKSNKVNSYLITKFVMIKPEHKSWTAFLNGWEEFTLS